MKFNGNPQGRTNQNIAKGKLEYAYEDYTLYLADETGNYIIYSDSRLEINEKELAPPQMDLSTIKSSDQKADNTLRKFRDVFEPVINKELDVQLKPTDWTNIAKEIVSYNLLHPKPVEDEDITATELEEISIETRVEAEMLKQENKHTQYIAETLGLKVLEQDDILPFRIVLHYSILTDRIDKFGKSSVLHPIASADSSGGKSHLENTLFELTPDKYINTFGRDYTLSYITRIVEQLGPYYMFRHYNRFGDLGNAAERREDNPMVQMKKALKSENKYSRGVSMPNGDGTYENVKLELLGGGQIVEEETEIIGEEQSENRVIRWNPNYGVSTRRTIQMETDDDIISMKRRFKFDKRLDVCRAIIQSNFENLDIFEKALNDLQLTYEIHTPTPMNNLFREAFEAYKAAGGMRFMDHPKGLLKGLVASNILNHDYYRYIDTIIIYPTIDEFKYIMTECYQGLYKTMHRELLDLNNKLDDLTFFVDKKSLDFEEPKTESTDDSHYFNYESLENFFTVSDWCNFLSKGSDASARNAARDKLDNLAVLGYLTKYGAERRANKYVPTKQLEEFIEENKKETYTKTIDYDKLEEDLNAFYADLEEEGFKYEGGIKKLVPDNV